MNLRCAGLADMGRLAALHTRCFDVAWDAKDRRADLAEPRPRLNYRLCGAIGLQQKTWGKGELSVRLVLR